MVLYHVAYTIESLSQPTTQDTDEMINNVRQKFRQDFLEQGVEFTVDTTFYKEDNSSLDDMGRMIMRTFHMTSRECNASDLCDIKYDLCQVINGTQRKKL